MQAVKSKYSFLLWVFSTVLSLCLGYMSWHEPVISGTITQPQHVRGYLYKATLPLPTGLTGLFFTHASLQENSGFTLRQDGHVLHDKGNSFKDIEAHGSGKYIYRYGQVYFSTLEHKNLKDVGSLTYEMRLALGEGGALLFLCAVVTAVSSFVYTFFPASFSSFLSTPCAQVTQNGLKRVLFAVLFLSVFLTYFVLTFEDGLFWRISPDTPGYWSYEYTKPWESVRSPGVKMFVDALGVGDVAERLPRYNYAPDGNVKLYTDYFAKEAQSNVALQYIVYVQHFLICFSFALFACALGTVLPCFWATLLPLFVLQFTIVPKAYELLTDPISYALCMLSVALVLFYNYYKNPFLLLGSIGIAIYAFLVRPSMIILVAVIGLALLKDFWLAVRDRKNMYVPVGMGCLLVCGIMLFPAQLYFSGKVVTLGQHGYMGKVMKAVAFATEEDIPHLATETDKQLLRKILAQRPLVDAQVEGTFMPRGAQAYSDVYKLSHSFDPYGWGLFRDSVGYESRFHVQKYVEGQNFAQQILQRHKGKNALLTLKILANSFGLYGRDYMQSPVLQTLHVPFLQQWFFPVVFLTILASLVWGVREMRFAILVLSIVHVVHMLAAAYGHFIVMRYVELTEWALLVAFAMALYGLCLARRKKA